MYYVKEIAHTYIARHTSPNIYPVSLAQGAIVMHNRREEYINAFFPLFIEQNI